MNLSIRPPRPEEWPACRMLLPEAFANPQGRHYLLALRYEAPRIAAAASYRPDGDAITHLRLHVSPPLRRRGVRSQLIRHLAQEARVLGGEAEILREPAAPAFCARNGFRRLDAVTTVKAELAPMRDYLARLRTRLNLPPGVRSVPFSEAPVEEIARLHSESVASQGGLDEWRGLVAHAPELEPSRVLMNGPRVVGILLGELQGDTAIIRSRAAAPGYQGGPINAVLLADGLEVAWTRGARHTVFTYNDANRDTQKLAERFKAEPRSILVRYVLP